MRLTVRKLLSLAFLIVSIPAWSAIKDIRLEQLPQDKAVKKAVEEVTRLEPYVKDWNGQWRFEIPKSEVASRMKSSLAALEKAGKTSPDNPELLLLTGLVAHYAYNVDVKQSYQIAEASFEEARKRMPSDVRPEWFLSFHHCQSAKIEEGMRGLLAIEEREKELPANFWDDYMSCATMANMPAHVLRAASHFAVADRTSYRDLLIEVAEKRFADADIHKTYSGQEVWTSAKAENGPSFMNSLCGISFWVKGEWKLNLPDVKNGQCIAQIEAGPYTSKGETVIPNILLLARPAQSGETLEQFLQSFMKYPGAQSLAPPACPAAACLASAATMPGMYKEVGDGHAIVTVFAREAPPFPGLLFEEPVAPNGLKAGKVTYFRPQQRTHRFAGKMYYLVVLDMASSILENAKTDYSEFLKGIKVE